LGKILNIKNLNSYCGRFSRESKKKSPQEIIGWYLYSVLMERIPVLVFRVIDLEDGDTSWPLSWKNGRNFKLAIELTLNMLKAWQAYRPEESKYIIRDLKKDLPDIILNFRKEMQKFNVKRARDIIRKRNCDSQEILRIISETVGEISSYKNKQNPMMGSKILNCFFPEIFPVWDTMWIKNIALKKENLDSVSLENWLPPKVINILDKNSKATLEYARYFSLMLKELKNTSDKEYKNIRKVFIRSAEIDEEIIDNFYYDIGPFLFEFCFLGKYSQSIRKEKRKIRR
jgi:hypothetical protein